jgi:flagellin-specific chaperone FliS
MKKADLIAQLEGAKALTSVVSIDNVIALIQKLEDAPKQVVSTKLTEAAAEDILNRIEQVLDYNSGDLADLSSAEFELNYDNRIELNRVDINVYDIMEHVRAAVEEFVSEQDEDEDEDTEEGVLRDVAE